MKKLFNRRNFLKGGLATTAAAAVLKNSDSEASGNFEGYPDGTFRPERDVNLVEALKMMLVGMNVDIQYSTSSEWYHSYYNTADAHYLIPDGLENQYTNDLSRVQAGEVIKGIMSLDADIVQPQIYTSEGGYEPGTVYIGYLQEGNVLDLYFVADNNIESYSNDSVGFVLQEGGLSDFSEDKDADFNYPGEDVALYDAVKAVGAENPSR